MYSANRQTPFFEFAGSRLCAGPHGTSGMPGYLDSLDSPATSTRWATPGRMPINFYAYFSSYGNDGYDPNDVNFPDSNSTKPPIPSCLSRGLPDPGATAALAGA